MRKLKLENIKKTYRSGEIVQALKGVSLEFGTSEFVCVLGPSGCGKTTLLNIIGGLDRYDSGEFEIDGLSTKSFNDMDWDAYRNNSIGFVFQNYNLIAHQSVLENVEIALTLSGVSAAERKKRAIEALISVGLADQMKKKPNQLSGGQMQRVAIARALVNNPDIILADEPTGSLDSHISIQIMEILKEIAKTKLVIMVTHNIELAKEYSNRIIRLLDGELQEDSNPIQKSEESKSSTDDSKINGKKPLFKKTSMSLDAATRLSFKNLLTKKGRTFITAFAGSIGIISIALVLALSTGLSNYMNQLQQDSLSGLPITITEQTQTVQSRGRSGAAMTVLTVPDTTGRFTDENVLYSYDNNANSIEHTNVFTQEYFNYIANIQNVLPEMVSAVTYRSGVEINLLARGEDFVVKFATVRSDDDEYESSGPFSSGLFWQEMYNDEEFILSLYDLIGEDSRLPIERNEVALVVDEYNQIDRAFFEKMGFRSNLDEFRLTDFIGATMLKVIPNDAYYTIMEDGLFVPASVSQYNALFNYGEGIDLTITGILRIKETSAALINYLSTGLVYTTALTDYIVNNAQNSQIANAQINSDIDVILNTPFTSESTQEDALIRLGAITTPVGISIYPRNYAAKATITNYLDAFNFSRPQDEQIVYTDIAAIFESMFGATLETVTMVLAGFAAISLIVSTIMIAIITYVSVLERTKEIGILRSVGARKKDISRVFNAEAVIVGLTAGLLGIGVAYLLIIPINLIISLIAGIRNIASLNLLYAVMLVLGSMFLTLIAAYIPSRMAAKKDPVEALRTE